MTELLLMRGYPASGKSTIAKNLVTEKGYVRVNRDDLRESLFGEQGVLSNDKEAIITTVQQTIAAKALTQGKSVVVDDMNLRLKFAREWADLALLHNVEFRVHDVPTSVGECLSRNARRAATGGRYVPADAIADIARRFPYPWPEVIPSTAQSLVVEPVEWDHELMPVVLCDIDGTVAHMTNRSPYDWSRVGEDRPDYKIIDLVWMLRDKFPVIFFSGRDSVCRKETLKWLNDEIGFITDEDLFMRPEGDMRKDSIVKYELFNEHIRGKYNVKYVLDDRKQVVEMWRALGLTVLAVADGDF